MSYKHSEYCPCKGRAVPDKAYTADRVEITQGLRVFTNNLDRGTVDLAKAEWEWHEPEKRHHLWFDVVAEYDYKGNPSTDRIMQSDDRVATRFQGRSA